MTNRRRRRKRPAHGYVVERRGKSGTSYALWYRFNGKRVYRTLGRSRDGYTRRDADRELQNLLADINRGQHREADERTFHEFASEWFHRKEPALKPATRDDYRNAIEVHLSPYFGDYLLSQITVEHVDSYKAHKLREGRLSPYSINKTLTRLGQVLKDAKRYGLIESNPARDADRLAESEPEGSYLEPFQVGPLLDELPERYRVLFELMLRAGLRIGEAAGLKWRDVDFPRSLLRLRRTAKAGRVSETTKSGDREALAHLTPEATRLLAEWWKREDDAGRGRDDEWVFPSKNGTPLRGDNVRKRVLRPAVKRANVKLSEAGLATIPERFTNHDLRRSCATLLFASGASLPEVMERGRWKDERTVMRVYAKVTKSRQAEVDAALDALLTSNKPATNGGFGRSREDAEVPQSRS
jgi:integrase